LEVGVISEADEIVRFDRLESEHDNIRACGSQAINCSGSSLANSLPITGHPYMLLHIEGRQERSHQTSRARIVGVSLLR
jgi:hypothetical protein